MHTNSYGLKLIVFVAMFCAASLNAACGSQTTNNNFDAVSFDNFQFAPLRSTYEFRCKEVIGTVVITNVDGLSLEFEKFQVKESVLSFPARLREIAKKSSVVTEITGHCDLSSDRIGVTLSVRSKEDYLQSFFIYIFLTAEEVKVLEISCEPNQGEENYRAAQNSQLCDTVTPTKN